MRQRGCILKPNGKRTTYSVKYRTAEGKQIFKSGFATKETAQRELNKALSQIDTGDYIEPKTITLATFSEQWLAGRHRIRGSTESGYASMIAKQIIPRIGSKRIADLRLPHFQQMVSNMMKDGLSVKTIHNVVTLIRTILAGPKGTASAVRLGYVRHDPTVGLELPKKESKEIVPPTPVQVWKLIDAAREVGNISYGFAFVGAFTGMRRNEILAIRFSDVDWFRRRVRVKTAVSKQRGTDGAHKWMWVIGQPKSKKSTRWIDLTDSAMKLLAELRALAADPDGFVFPGENGEFIDPDKFDAEIWAAVTKLAGMAGTRYHDLRHFFASQLIANGETAAYVRDQMGHSSIQVTFDTYGHLFPGSGQEASKRLEESMRKARNLHTGSKTVALSPEDAPETGIKQPVN